MFGDEIKNKNKHCYSNFYACTEAKIAFIPAEELKDSKMNKISETKKPKDNRYGPANVLSTDGLDATPWS